MKGNVIVGQSGGPTAVINSSLAGVYKTAMERGFNKVYGMRYGIQGFLDEQYVDLSDHIKNELDLELLKRTPSAFLGTCRYKLPEIHEDKAVYERIFELLDRASELLAAPGIPHDGYYAFVCEKCAPSFEYYGYFMEAEHLKQEAGRIYEGT